jgi:hypothetical protein
MDNSFTYIIASQERTNNLPAAGIQMNYDINFGGFIDQYDDYMCEVVSFTLVAGYTTTNTNWLVCVKNLAENGYFCKSKLNPKECVLTLLPLSQAADATIQSDGGYSIFRVNNCRSSKQVSFFFLKSDFTPVLNETDINIPIPGPPIVPVETKWLLTLKMTPIEKGK